MSTSFPARSFLIPVVATMLLALAHAQAGWDVVPSPSPGSEMNMLYAAHSASATDGWAVGWGYSDPDQPHSLTLHWDGAAWKTVPSPSPGNSNNCHPNEQNILFGVSSLPTGEAWAVGYYCYLPPHPLLVSWDGTRWKQVTVPLPAGSSSAQLFGVAAIAANDVWIVGYYQTRQAQYASLTEHWDGTKWSIVPSPGSSQAYLWGIAAVSSNNVWAVGYILDRSLIEHWDGSNWSIVPSANPGNLANNLYGITIVDANDIWAVGAYESYGTSYRGLVQHWDGTAWKLVASPETGTEILLWSVAAVSANDIWAVGWEDTDTLNPITQHWNGTRWRIVSTPDPGKAAQLFGVNVSAGRIWAVGAYSKTGVRGYGGSLENPLTFIIDR